MSYKLILPVISILYFSCKDNTHTIVTPIDTQPKYTAVTIYQSDNIVSDTKKLGYGINSEIILSTSYYDVTDFDSISFSWKSSVSPFLDTATLNPTNRREKIVYLDYLILVSPIDQKQFTMLHLSDSTTNSITLNRFEIIHKDNISFKLKMFAALNTTSSPESSKETIKLSIGSFKIIGYK